MSSFGKIRLSGKDSEDFLQKICGNNIAVPVGKIVYTQFLNDDGGIESDVTITRLSSDEFIIVTPAATIALLRYIKKNKETLLSVLGSKEDKKIIIKI